MFDQNCQSCNFFEEAEESDMDIVGHCCRFPPVPYYDPQAETLDTAWPFVHGEYWCGEHEEVE
jgi:hypothetical protein